MAPTVGKQISTSGTKHTTSFGNFLKRPQSVFGSRKKDKRLTRRSALISRIEKSIAPSKKRRRPSKKLITDLESLANALPEIPATPADELDSGPAKIKYKSFETKPGAMKKKERLINMEKERFNQNMAALHKGTQDTMTLRGEATGVNDTTKEKFALIREFIQQTIEKHPGSRPSKVGLVT